MNLGASGWHEIERCVGLCAEHEACFGFLPPPHRPASPSSCILRRKNPQKPRHITVIMLKDKGKSGKQQEKDDSQQGNPKTNTDFPADSAVRRTGTERPPHPLSSDHTDHMGTSLATSVQTTDEYTLWHSTVTAEICSKDLFPCGPHGPRLKVIHCSVVGQCQQDML